MCRGSRRSGPLLSPFLSCRRELLLAASRTSPRRLCVQPSRASCQAGAGRGARGAALTSSGKAYCTCGVRLNLCAAAPPPTPDDGVDRLPMSASEPLAHHWPQATGRAAARLAARSTAWRRYTSGRPTSTAPARSRTNATPQSSLYQHSPTLRMQRPRSHCTCAARGRECLVRTHI